MPKRRLHISDFRSQVRPADDPGDLRLEEAEYAENVSLTAMPGALTGRPSEEPRLTSLSSVKAMSFSDDQNLLFVENGSNYVIRDMVAQSNTTVSGSPPSGSPNTAVARQESCRFGHAGEKAKWVGQIEHGQFGGSAPSGTWHVRDAELIALEAPILTTSGTVSSARVECNTEKAAFEEGTSTYYAFSLIYDGYQEGPLRYFNYIPFLVNPNDSKKCNEYHDVTFEVDASLLPDRVTHIVLYGITLPFGDTIGFGPDDKLDEPEEAASFKKVAQIPITTADWDSSEWSNPSGTKWRYTVRDEYEWQTTYNKRTGVTQQLDHMKVEYGLAAKANGFTFYAQADVKDVPESRSYVYRSKAGRPDMIDWSLDQAKLDFEPVALQSYGGGVAAFGRGEGVLLNPQDMTVEQSFGVGAVGQHAVTAHHGLLFWCSQNNIYLFDGDRVRSVGEPILHTPPTALVEGWRDLSNSRKEEVGCMWVQKADSFVLLFPQLDTNAQEEMVLGWALHLPQTFWDEQQPRPHWVALDTGITGQTSFVYAVAEGTPSGRSNLALMSIGGDVYDLWADDNNRLGWRWVSKEIGGGQPGPERVFYHLETVGSDLDLADVRYREDRGLWQTANSSQTELGRTRYEVNSSSSPPWKGVTRFQFELDGAADETIRSASLTVRERAQTS